MEYQCWICPNCHDDHSLRKECTPKDDRPFYPTDETYIAREYRNRMQEIAELKAQVAMLTQAKERWRLLEMDASAKNMTLTEILATARRDALEEAALRCERGAAEIIKQVPLFFLAMIAADTCTSCANEIRALSST